MEKEQKPDSPLLGFLIVAFLVLLLIGFAIFDGYTQSLKLQEQQEAEASDRAHYAEHNQSVSTFPHAMNIGGKAAYLSSVDMLELYGNHSYTGYVAIAIDRGELTDDDMYWILKGERRNWELDASAALLFLNTDKDSISLRLLGCRYSESHIYFFFYSEPQRQSLRGCTFYVTLEYLQDGADESDRYTYTYHCDFSGAKYHSSTDFLPQKTQKALSNAMANAAS